MLSGASRSAHRRGGLQLVFESAARGRRARCHRAAAATGRLKYQDQVGPTRAACARLIRERLRLGPVALQALLDWVIYTALIGNTDANGRIQAFGYRTSMTGISSFVLISG